MQISFPDAAIARAHILLGVLQNIMDSFLQVMFRGKIRLPIGHRDICHSKLLIQKQLFPLFLQVADFCTDIAGEIFIGYLVFTILIILEDELFIRQLFEDVGHIRLRHKAGHIPHVHFALFLHGKCQGIHGRFRLFRRKGWHNGTGCENICFA